MDESGGFIDWMTPDPCPECGIGDAEYGVHKSGCPSGYPTIDDTDRERDAMQDAMREMEDVLGAFDKLPPESDLAAEFRAAYDANWTREGPR